MPPTPETTYLSRLLLVQSKLAIIAGDLADASQLVSIADSMSLESARKSMLRVIEKANDVHTELRLLGLNRAKVERAESSPELRTQLVGSLAKPDHFDMAEPGTACDARAYAERHDFGGTDAGGRAAP